MIMEFLTLCFKFGFFVGLFSIALIILFYSYVFVVSALIKTAVFIFDKVLNVAIFIEDKLR